MQTVLLNSWNNRAAELPYKDAYQALIVASLIEKETSLNNERPIIAGVIMRRLQKRMLLQIDPTVIYGLGNAYNGKLTSQDLKNENPYNTYLHLGLPPTPIAMPSSPSIYAALHPATGDVLYYVATGEGGHEFSETLEQQNIAVHKYRLKQQMQAHEALRICPLPNKLGSSYENKS